jgi:hypothetical protein
MVASGALVLAFQRVFWTRLTAMADKIFGQRQVD